VLLGVIRGWASVACARGLVKAVVYGSERFSATLSHRSPEAILAIRLVDRCRMRLLRHRMFLSRSKQSSSSTSGDRGSGRHAVGSTSLTPGCALFYLLCRPAFMRLKSQERGIKTTRASHQIHDRFLVTDIAIGEPHLCSSTPRSRRPTSRRTTCR
jgi:hypothetical protein